MTLRIFAKLDAYEDSLKQKFASSTPRQVKQTRLDRNADMHPEFTALRAKVDYQVATLPSELGLSVAWANWPSVLDHDESAMVGMLYFAYAPVYNEYKSTFKDDPELRGAHYTALDMKLGGMHDRIVALHDLEQTLVKVVDQSWLAVLMHVDDVNTAARRLPAEADFPTEEILNDAADLPDSEAARKAYSLGKELVSALIKRVGSLYIDLAIAVKRHNTPANMSAWLSRFEAASPPNRLDVPRVGLPSKTTVYADLIEDAMSAASPAARAKFNAVVQDALRVMLTPSDKGKLASFVADMRLALPT